MSDTLIYYTLIYIYIYIKQNILQPLLEKLYMLIRLCSKIYPGASMYYLSSFNIR